ncbi:MAG: zinc ABC transporter substrate-binding protein [Phycisphaeraceae bacterium]|nr:zinc ABC transporter substrate-binding protein [Phycisphaeraceae bacterium]
MIRLRLLLIPLVAACMLIAGASVREEPPEPAPIKAVVTVAPLKGLVEPLLPPGSTVEMLIPPGVSEHGYEIPPSKLALLAKADLVVYVGLGLEPQVEKFLKDNPRPTRKTVCFAEAVGVKADPADQHDHGPGDADHDHGHDHAIDPHLWLDPILAKRFVTHLGLEVVDLLLTRADEPDPTIRLASTKAMNALLDRIDKVDREYEHAISDARYKTIVVAHDAFGRLGKRYSLRVVPIAGLNAAEPTPSDIERATAAVNEQAIKVVFVEPQLSKSTAQRIADATGARVLTLDPLGDGDWFALMSSNLKSIRTALNPSLSDP